jgi:hypothetical protein
MVWYGMVRHGMAGYGMAWYGRVWQGMAAVMCTEVWWMVVQLSIIQLLEPTTLPRSRNCCTSSLQEQTDQAGPQELPGKTPHYSPHHPPPPNRARPTKPCQPQSLGSLASGLLCPAWVPALVTRPEPLPVSHSCNCRTSNPQAQTHQWSLAPHSCNHPISQPQHQPSLSLHPPPPPSIYPPPPRAQRTTL